MQGFPDDRTADQLSRIADSLSAIAAELREVADQPAATAPEAEPGPEPNGGGPPPSAERLVAIQMALSGSAREETEAYLRRSYPSSDPSRTLDELYG